MIKNSIIARFVKNKDDVDFTDKIYFRDLVNFKSGQMTRQLQLFSLSNIDFIKIVGININIIICSFIFSFLKNY